MSYYPLRIKKEPTISEFISSNEFSLFSQELTLAPRHPFEFSLFSQELTLAPRHR